MTRMLERSMVIPGFAPVDFNDNDTQNGDYVSLKNYGKIVVYFISGLGTGGDDPTITITQTTDVTNSASDAKALDFTTIYRKQAATDLSAVGQWTKTTQSAANTYTQTDAAEQVALWAIEFDALELDVPNDFDCLRAVITGTIDAAQPIFLWYELGDPVYPSKPEGMLSGIVD